MWWEGRRVIVRYRVEGDGGERDNRGCCVRDFKTDKGIDNVFFFFSSRRRHTRYWRDWSSDVCSSDLAERDALAAQNERLRHLLLKLQRRQFGRKSERLPEDHLLFAFEEVEATLAGNAAEAGKHSPTLRGQQARRRRAGRGRLPAHLPRVEVVLAPEATACPCCQGPLVEIGTDTSERLDAIPARFRVVVTKRPKLACRACAGVVLQAPAPARLIEGGMPTEATVAHVLVSRYADHLPLFRQEIGRAHV